MLLKEILDSQDFGNSLSEAEKVLMAYAVAAHTHYLKPASVKCSDDEMRTVEPYMDLDEQGKPLLGIWLPRWVDRLDCNGPTFVGRHYFTLAHTHKDFDGVAHFDVSLPQHMRPFLRPFKEQTDELGNRNQTMSEHMKMFADSQNNESPYGKHDFGEMIHIRDLHTDMLRPIIQATQQGEFFTDERLTKLREAWNTFLSTYIEPTPKAREDVAILDREFSRLDSAVVNAWSHSFLETMKQYQRWADIKLSRLSGLSDRALFLPILQADVRDLIRPRSEWKSLVERL